MPNFLVCVKLFIFIKKQRFIWVNEKKFQKIKKKCCALYSLGVNMCPLVRAVSSVGRATRLHRVGREFEPLTAHHYQHPLCGGVAQLVRVPACHAGGRRFEPGHFRHF